MGIKSPGLIGEEHGGSAMSWPTRPMDPDQEAHNQGGLEIVIR
jgi:hypothetical protein